VGLRWNFLGWKAASNCDFTRQRDGSRISRFVSVGIRLQQCLNCVAAFRI
jgi:hypothetical protein